MEITNKTDHSKHLESIDSTYDRDWVKSTFVLKDTDFNTGDEYIQWIKKNRYYSTADIKFTSTSPGMNVACNPKPQFTRYCDIRSKGKIITRDDITLNTRSNPDGLGMGRYYSEAIDDNQQRIYLRFGVPKYTPLLLWIYKSFDVNKVVMQNRGVITTALLDTVNLVSKFFAIAAAPMLALGMFAVNAIVQSSRFYSVKETMYVYWATVENILNQMATRRTMLPYGFLQEYTIKLDETLNREQKPNQEFIQSLNELLPGIVDPETGRISVFALALRGQATFNRMQYADLKKNDIESLGKDFTGYRETGSTTHDTYFTSKDGKANFFTKYLFNAAYKLLGTETNEVNNNGGLDQEQKSEQSSLIEMGNEWTTPEGGFVDHKGNPNEPDDTIEKRLEDNAKNKKPYWDNYREYLLAELSEGAAFAVFNVENTGSIGESFSSSFGQNPLESMFNSLSAKSRNIGDLLSSASNIPIVGDAMKFASDAGATILNSASFGIANPLLALAYGVNISMPKIWESSSASLPRASYKLKLISPYGNAYSQLFNIYLPLAMILAGSLPRATGRSSHTYPFFCQLFDRGRTNIQLGMIETVSLTRGTSNLAFSRNGHPNSIDVDLNIANLDEIIAVDVSDSGFVGKVFDALSPDFSDTPFTSYLNTITGVDVYTQIYKIPQFRLKLAERYATIKSVVQADPAAFAAFTVNTIPGMKFIGQNALGNNQQAMLDLTTR